MDYTTQFFLPHVYISLYKVRRTYFLNSGVKGLKYQVWVHASSLVDRQYTCTTRRSDSHYRPLKAPNNNDSNAPGRLILSLYQRGRREKNPGTAYGLPAQVRPVLARRGLRTVAAFVPLLALQPGRSWQARTALGSRGPFWASRALRSIEAGPGLLRTVAPEFCVKRLGYFLDQVRFRPVFHAHVQPAVPGSCERRNLKHYVKKETNKQTNKSISEI